MNVKKPTISWLKYSGLIGSILASASTVSAQDLTVAPAPDARAGGLEDIIVTARKRAESVQDIPVSMTAMTSAQIDRAAITNMERLTATTPQLNIARAPSGAGAQFTLRGIGSSSTSIGLEQSVALIIDGVYYGSGRAINEGLFDLERIEVIKGPQALFYGKNATAGVVSIATAEPTAQTELMARAGYEFEAEQVYGEVAGSTPLTETLGVRLALRGAKMWGGYVRNRAGPVSFSTVDVATGQTFDWTAPPAAGQSPGDREFMGRITLKWEPTDRLAATLRASGTIYDSNNVGWSNVVFRCPTGTSALDPGVPCRRKFEIRHNAMPVEMARETVIYEDSGELKQHYRGWSVTGTINYDVTDEINVTSVTNYHRNKHRFSNDGDYQSGPVLPLYAADRSTWRAFSNETRIATDFDGPLNLLLGGYYQWTKRGYALLAHTAGIENSAAPAGLRYVGFLNESGTKGETLAAFGQAIWNITDTLEATAGVRYTHETKDSFFFRPYVNPAFAEAYPNQRIIGDQSFSDWSPEITLSWQPTGDYTFYGAFKTAYKSGGFSNSSNPSVFSSPGDLAFNPETASGFEGGVKATLLDNQLRANLTLYSFKYKNLQIDFYNSETISFITTNAGSAKTRGVELDFQFAPHATPELTLTGGVNYNRARYSNYIAPCYVGQTPAQGCTTIAFGAPGQDMSGSPLAVAPEWTAFFGANYDQPLGSGLVLGLSGDARYSSSYLGSSFGNPLSRQPEFVTLDAAIRLRSEDSRWEAALLGQNLTNRFIINGAIDGTNTGSGTGTPEGVPADQFGFISPPRTIRLQLTYRY